jgi:menaquinol-cytochrome c reductase iron-sulfur subunit
LTDSEEKRPEDEGNEESPSVPTPSLWPIGFAIGIAVALIGLVISVWVLVAGAVIALVFGFLWVYDLFRAHGPVEAAEPGTSELPDAEHVPTYDRSAFLSASTIGMGAAIGALVTLPVLGFMVLPSFEEPETPEVDLGPIRIFPEGTFVIANFLEAPAQGEVSRRTAYVRNNGLTEDQAGESVPSFTILSSRCVHLGCPVQANGPFDGAPLDIEEAAEQEELRPTLQPVLAESFGCPCHGGLYDGEGNRTAGPPVRSLDRYEFSVVDGRLVLGRLFSVGSVDGTRENAVMARYGQSSPGVHVDGWEAWLYPIPVPYSE